MRQVIRWRYINIPNKLNGDIRFTIDDRSVEYSSTYEGGQSTSINILPIIGLNITRPYEIDETGKRVRPAYNPNDGIGMTKFNMPVFLKELKGIEQDMTIPNLYEYTNSRLELNSEVAEKVRRVFMLGNATLELAAVVIEQPDETKVEGIKLTINNESSSVLLTLNELTALIWTLDHLDIDNLVMQMYFEYIRKGTTKSSVNSAPKPLVDIQPKQFKEFQP